MGDGVLNSLGLGGGSSVSPGSRKASITDLQKMKMVGAEAARKNFTRHTKQKWRRGVGEKIKTKNLGTISADELREDIIADIRKKGLSGYSGKQLEKKLYKKMGVERKTRRRIMTEMGKMYVKTSSLGLTDEEKKKNVKIGNVMNDMYRSSAGKLSDNKKKEGIKSKFKTDSTSIGAQQKVYKTSIGGGVQRSDDYRGTGVKSQQGKQESKFGLSSTDATTDVAGGFGVKQGGDSDTMGMFKRFGQADDYQMKKVG